VGGLPKRGGPLEDVSFERKRSTKEASGQKKGPRNVEKKLFSESVGRFSSGGARDRERRRRDREKGTPEGIIGIRGFLKQFLQK